MSTYHSSFKSSPKKPDSPAPLQKKALSYIRLEIPTNFNAKSNPIHTTPASPLMKSPRPLTARKTPNESYLTKTSQTNSLSKVQNTKKLYIGKKTDDTFVKDLVTKLKFHSQSIPLALSPVYPSDKALPILRITQENLKECLKTGRMKLEKPMSPILNESSKGKETERSKPCIVMQKTDIMRKDEEKVGKKEVVVKKQVIEFRGKKEVMKIAEPNVEVKVKNKKSLTGFRDYQSELGENKKNKMYRSSPYVGIYKMSFFSYPEACSVHVKTYFPLVFLVPYVLRSLYGLATKTKLERQCKRCYLQLTFLCASSFVYESWPSYFTYLFFLLNFSMVILSAASATNTKVPNILECLITLSFCVLLITPAVYWAGIGFVWALVSLKSFTQPRFSSVVLGLLQITSGVLACSAGAECRIHEFYVLSCISLSLITANAEVYKPTMKE